MITMVTNDYKVTVTKVQEIEKARKPTKNHGACKT